MFLSLLLLIVILFLYGSNKTSMHFLPFKTWHHWSPARVSLPELHSFSCFFEVSPLTRVAAVDPAVSSVILDSLCSYQWAFRLFPVFALPRGTVLILVRRALHIFVFGNCSALGFSGCTSCWKAASQNTCTSWCSRSYHGRGLLLPQPQRPIVLSDLLPFAGLRFWYSSSLWFLWLAPSSPNPS